MNTLIQTTKNGYIYDYNDRSFAVVSAPGSLWETLSDLGGLLSVSLKGLPDKRGWVFSKKKLDTVKLLLASSTTTTTPLTTEGPPATASSSFYIPSPPAPEPSKTTKTATATSKTPANGITTLMVRSVFSDLKEQFADDGEYDGTTIKELIEEAKTRLIKGDV